MDGSAGQLKKLNGKSASLSSECSIQAGQWVIVKTLRPSTIQCKCHSQLSAASQLINSCLTG